MSSKRANAELHELLSCASACDDARVRAAAAAAASPSSALRAALSRPAVGVGVLLA
jgi:hypothetical protein